MAKMFTEHQLNILPEMGYYVERFSNPYNLNDTHNQFIGMYCLMNGQLKFYGNGEWYSHNWNVGPTKNKIKESLTKRGYNYEYFSKFEDIKLGEFEYIPSIKAPNDFQSELNGTARPKKEVNYTLPDGFDYGWYVIKNEHYYIVLYVSNKKAWSNVSYYKTFGQISYCIKNSQCIYYKTYGDMILNHPDVVNDSRVLKTKPVWSE